jgi:hypothetical protein
MAGPPLGKLNYGITMKIRIRWPGQPVASQPFQGTVYKYSTGFYTPRPFRGECAPISGRWSERQSDQNTETVFYPVIRGR